MATEFQVTFDSADPGAHAAFWAEAVHYVQPPPPPGFDSWDAALDDWRVPADHRNDRAALVDPDGAGPRLFFQKVPDGTCCQPATGGRLPVWPLPARLSPRQARK
jgi:hypothetical protein